MPSTTGEVFAGLKHPHGASIPIAGVPNAATSEYTAPRTSDESVKLAYTLYIPKNSSSANGSSGEAVGKNTVSSSAVYPVICANTTPGAANVPAANAKTVQPARKSV